MTQDDAKKAAALAAAEALPKEGIIGLGSGSTATFFIEEVGRLVREGRKLVGVPTSEGSRALAHKCGIPLLSDEGPWSIEMTVDGADEVSESLDLIKGGGAAHTREKIVSFASKKNIIIVDASKLSKRLGEKWPVPLEVLPFAHLQTVAHLRVHGEPVMRMKDGAPRLTDAGNYVYDLKTGPIADPAALDRALRDIPGIVETGLFVQRADAVVVAETSGIRKLIRGA